jgi:hypothetical protein
MAYCKDGFLQLDDHRHGENCGRGPRKSARTKSEASDHEKRSVRHEMAEVQDASKPALKRCCYFTDEVTAHAKTTA